VAGLGFGASLAVGLVGLGLVRPCRGVVDLGRRCRSCAAHAKCSPLLRIGVSERQACRTLGQHRFTQRKVPQGRPDEELLTQDIIELARQYGRYGYRPVTALLNQSGWHVNHKRVERIWKRKGLTYSLPWPR
jgi:hypothetical protein